MADQSVPGIAPIQVQSASGGVASSDDIGSLIAPIAAQAAAPLPDVYAVGKQIAQPHLNPVTPATQYNDHRQITGSVADKNRARRQNSVAGLANVIGSFRQKWEEKKQTALKDKLVDFMGFKQNAENATVILNDPSASQQEKQAANQVLNDNKQKMEAMMSDKKNQHDFLKALDVSYVDPEKNKTPEVQAYQAAAKEFKASGPFSAANPQEHAVAQVAAKAGGSSSGNQMQPQKPNLPASKPTITVTQAPRTPYADAALAKDPSSMEVNPHYAPALAAKQAAQKQLTTIIPRLIDAESKAQVQAAKDGNAASRLIFQKQADAARQYHSDIAKLEGVEEKDRTSLKVAASRYAAQVSAAQIRANSIIKVAGMKQLTADQKKLVKQQGLTEIDKQISSISSNLASYDHKVAAMKAVTPKDQQASALATLAMQRQMDSNTLSQLQQIRTGVVSDNSMMVNDASASGTSTVDQELNNFNGMSTPTNSTKEDKPEPVGQDASDDPDDYDN